VSLIFHLVKIEKNNRGNIRVRIYQDKKTNRKNPEKLLNNDEGEKQSFVVYEEDEDSTSINKDIFGNKCEEFDGSEDLFEDFEDEESKNETEIEKNIFGSQSNELRNTNQDNISVDIKVNNSRDIQSIEEYISSYFSGKEFVEISESYNKLILSVKIDDSSIAVIINFDVYKNQLIIAAYLEYKVQYVEDLLKMFSKIEMIGSLSIDNSYGKDFSIVRYIASIDKHSDDEIIGIIDRIIFEANLVSKKISESYG